MNTLLIRSRPCVASSPSVKHKVSIRNWRLPVARQEDVLEQLIALYVSESTAILIRMLIEPAIQPVARLMQGKGNAEWLEVDRLGREAIGFSGRTSRPPENDNEEDDQRSQNCADDLDHADHSRVEVVVQGQQL